MAKNSPNIHPHCGEPKFSTEKITDICGVILQAFRHTIPLSQAMQGDEYEAYILAQQPWTGRDDLRLMNCCRCQRELLAPSEIDRLEEEGPKNLPPLAILRDQGDGHRRP